MLYGCLALTSLISLGPWRPRWYWMSFSSSGLMFGSFNFYPEYRFVQNYTVPELEHMGSDILPWGRSHQKVKLQWEWSRYAKTSGMEGHGKYLQSFPFPVWGPGCSPIFHPVILTVFSPWATLSWLPVTVSWRILTKVRNLFSIMM